MTWAFRNRIEVGPTSMLGSDDPEWIIDDSEPGKTIKLIARFPSDIPLVPGGYDRREPERTGPLSQARTVILTGASYAAEAEALDAGRCWVSRLMRAFSVMKIGANFGGDDQPSGGITPAGAKMLAPGQRIISDQLRLITYEDAGEAPTFIYSPPVTARRGGLHVALAGAMQEAIRTGGLDSDHRVAYGLYAGSFGLAAEPRLALLMAAVEVMMKAERRSAAAQALIDRWIGEADASLPVDEAKALQDAMEFMRKDSISRTGRKLAATLAPKEYAGRTAVKFFTHCYELRSRIMHGNTPLPTTIELGAAAATLENFVGDLLAKSAP